jgi:hypothetical protein
VTEAWGKNGEQELINKYCGAVIAWFWWSRRLGRSNAMWHRLLWLRLRTWQVTDCIIWGCGVLKCNKLEQFLTCPIHSYNNFNNVSFGFDSGFPHSLLKGGRIIDCLRKKSKNIRLWGVPSLFYSN